jgi:transposase
LVLSLGHLVKVANTAGEAWKFTHLKRKTDRDDARKLADLDQLLTVVLPDPPTRRGG